MSKMHCPHCESPAIVRSSRAMSSILREVIYSCENPYCGCAFVAYIQADRILSPPALPNPKVNLPFSPVAGRRLKFKNNNKSQLNLF